MKNLSAVMDVCQQLIKVCERISSLATGISVTENMATDMTKVYEGLMYDETEHAQILTLEMTKLVTSEDMNTDEGGSVFSAGELDSEKTVENPDDEDVKYA